MMVFSHKFTVPKVIFDEVSELEIWIVSVKEILFTFKVPIIFTFCPNEMSL